ncbi:MAG: hypothetical protein KA143_04480 [Saprospiraceae bacterium]|nr:hypothetical protein [Saprospiraceae bacterium]
MAKYAMLLVLLCSTVLLCSQSELIINSNIQPLKDSVENKKLVEAFNAFLNKAQRTNEENDLVLESEKVETYVLLDEVNGIQKSVKYQDSVFYKPYLTNIVKLSDKEFFLQVSYVGVKDTIPLIRASFDFIAHKTKESFLFSSPLKMNTNNWKIENTGEHSFYYEHTLNKSKANEYSRLVLEFDTKLKSVNTITKVYCFKNLIHLQRILGVPYKSDYNGHTSSIWTASSGKDQILLLGNNNEAFDNFDPHDLWHDRLSRVVPRSQVNKPVDEGCAYLYGGSWGMSWKEIFNEFKTQIASDRNTDWLAVKENPVYFPTKEFKNNADNIVNALLIKKIEKEKGFEGVWQLLNCGKQEKGNQKYFQTLEKITGINKEKYNAAIWKLIDAEK